MSERYSLIAFAPATFVCPAYDSHEFPDDVGKHVCECGATTEVYDTGKEPHGADD